jgi:hypothetical protein
MTGHRAIVRRFGDRERERLAKLFSQLGNDNKHEAEAARSRIDALLRHFDKEWADLIELLGGAPVRADLARDIIALGSSNPDERANARRNLAELLARHRKSWNDLADVLCANSREAWACNPSADDPARVNPLALVLHLLEDYVALQPHQYIAVALWALHTHAYYGFMVTPRLALRSPVADCGKSTLLSVLEKLTARPQKFDSITTAAIYHLIDQTHPTLLIDEADNLGLALQPNGRLRAVFNSGHRNGGAIAISESGSTRKFSTFSPLALAFPEMRGLPNTLNSRCITITIERSQRTLRRFDANHPDAALDTAYQQILLWGREVKLDPDPEMPAGMRNRFADNWRPLISIADSLGWGEQARAAMIAFAREYQDADAKILLLTDIRKVFNARKEDRLPSKTLLDALHALDGCEWSEFSGVRGEQQPHKLKDSELAIMLRDFAIRPRTIWPLNRTTKSKSAKGYRRAQFEEVWRKYCADDVTTSHANNIRSLRHGGDNTT